MPIKAEKSLKKEARKHNFKAGSPRYNRYVFGTLAKIKKAEKRKRK